MLPKTQSQGSSWVVQDTATGTRDRQKGGRILAADDQPHILEAIELLLRPQGFEVDTAKSPAAVREALASDFYDAVLIDLNYTRDTTSGQEGLDLLSEIVAFDSSIPVIVMTAWGNVGLAVEAMRRGARDFIQKPWENERLLAILRTQVELHRALQRTQRLEAEAKLLRAEGRPDFIAAAPSMQPVLQTIARIGPSDANVLVTGEHGTGKRDSGPDFSCVIGAGFDAAGSREYRRTTRGHLRKRIIRPRERRLHRRAYGPHRTFRIGRQRHHLSR
jgi:FixJ family two-component response regulator